MKINLHEFNRVTECHYDGEKYTVRDNGSVFRHPRSSSRNRQVDNHWTFGKPNNKTGYMEIASVRVHRIVATAFHGDPPTPEHVVDHIDTNRRNNRPENLRWLTRLENALLNPITVKRIEFICGSIEAFIEDPSRLRHGSLERNFEWMRTVSPQEAKASFERMKLWAKSNKPSSGGSLGEWIYKPIISPKLPLETEATNAVRDSKERAFNNDSLINTPAETDLVIAKTPGAAQRRWKVPSEFPCCPQYAGERPIEAYAENLKKGSVFARNQFSITAVLEFALSDDFQSLWILCEQQMENAIKPWSLAQVNYENELYVHTSLGTFFEKRGAEKQFCLAQGREWTGEDSIDDYC